MITTSLTPPTFSPDNQWFIDTMNSVFELGGDLVRREVAHNLMRIIAEGRCHYDVLIHYDTLIHYDILIHYCILIHYDVLHLNIL